MKKLQLSYYQPLITLLQLQNPKHYQDLINLVSNKETQTKYFVSATYRNNLYAFYQKKDSRQMNENQLNLATNQIIYQLNVIQK